ncbi:hypothetical protein ABIE32_001824 [Comamonas sp. 4034]
MTACAYEDGKNPVREQAQGLDETKQRQVKLPVPPTSGAASTVVTLSSLPYFRIYPLRAVETPPRPHS